MRLVYVLYREGAEPLAVVADAAVAEYWQTYAPENRIKECVIGDVDEAVADCDALDKALRKRTEVK